MEFFPYKNKITNNTPLFPDLKLLDGGLKVAVYEATESFSLLDVEQRKIFLGKYDSIRKNKEEIRTIQESILVKVPGYYEYLKNRETLCTVLGTALSKLEREDYNLEKDLVTLNQNLSSEIVQANRAYGRLFKEISTDTKDLLYKIAERGTTKKSLVSFIKYRLSCLKKNILLEHNEHSIYLGCTPLDTRAEYLKSKRDRDRFSSSNQADNLIPDPCLIATLKTLLEDKELDHSDQKQALDEEINVTLAKMLGFISNCQDQSFFDNLVNTNIVSRGYCCSVTDTISYNEKIKNLKKDIDSLKKECLEILESVTTKQEVDNTAVEQPKEEWMEGFE